MADTRSLVVHLWVLAHRSSQLTFKLGVDGAPTHSTAKELTKLMLLGEIVLHLIANVTHSTIFRPNINLSIIQHLLLALPGFHFVDEAAVVVFEILL